MHAPSFFAETSFNYKLHKTTNDNIVEELLLPQLFTQFHTILNKIWPRFTA